MQICKSTYTLYIHADTHWFLRLSCVTFYINNLVFADPDPHHTVERSLLYRYLQVHVGVSPLFN